LSVQVRIVVDKRESASGIPDLLQRLGTRVELRLLDVGDYIISPECAIERKDVHDFLASLFSGRLFSQAHRLSSSYKLPVLIVEGELQVLLEESAKPRVIWGALGTLTFGYGLHIFFTPNPQQTADFIFTIAKHGHFARPRGPLIQKKPKAVSIQEQQLNVTSMLPGVGTVLADRLLRHFGSVRRLGASSVSELALVNGIGRVKAEKIVKLLDAPYRPAEKRPAQARLE